MIYPYRNQMLSRVNLRQIGEVAGEQITLAQARLHLRLDDDGDSPPSHPDDPWLTDFGIPAAREWCEAYLGRALAPTVFELSLGAFPRALSYANWSALPETTPSTPNASIEL